MLEDSDDKKPLVRFAIVWGLAGVLESPILNALLNSQHQYIQSHFKLILLLHLSATVLMFFAVPRGKGWFHPRRIWPRTFLLHMFFLPVFGWLMVGALFFAYRSPENPSEIFSDMESEGFFRVEGPLTMPALLDSREKRLYRELDFMPLTDILASDDLNLKRGAVEKLAQLATPEAIAVLMSYRSDAVPEVRFYVTSALTRIKKEMDEELDAAKKQMKSNVYNAEGRLHLAKVYLRYVQSGLLDESTGRVYQSEAAHHMEFAIQSRTRLKEAVSLLLSLYRTQQNWSGALSVIAKVEGEEELDKTELQKQKIEMLYSAGRYAQVIAELKTLKASGFSDPKWDAAAYLWGAHA